jgi:hypothetical protein
MYRFLRVFCATAWELEGERRAFYDVIGEFNESAAMQHGILYVPVSITNAPDKRPYQYTIEENIRDCRHYILAVDEDWGPRERNFERDYRLAVECSRAPQLPMRGTAILLRTLPDGSPSPFGKVLSAAGFSYTAFADVEEFRKIVRQLLAEWLPADIEQPAASAASPA